MARQTQEHIIAQVSALPRLLPILLVTVIPVPLVPTPVEPPMLAASNVMVPVLPRRLPIPLVMVTPVPLLPTPVVRRRPMVPFNATVPAPQQRLPILLVMEVPVPEQLRLLTLAVNQTREALVLSNVTALAAGQQARLLLILRGLA